MAADRRGGDGTLERLLRGNAVRTTITLTCTLATWLAAWLTTGPIASAQSDHYPARPITLLVPFPPGGSADTVIRPVAEKVADALKQPIVIDNRTGGGGNVAALATKQAAPDGYTLFLTNMGVMAVNPMLLPDLRFDPVKDFAPITPIISFPHILVVPPDSPAKTVAELAAYAKTKPGSLSFGSQGVGSGGQILGEMFRARVDAPMVHVPFRGAAPAATEIMAGRIDFSLPPTSRSASRPRRASSGSSRSAASSASASIPKFRPWRRPAFPVSTSRCGTAWSDPQACPRRSSNGSTRNSARPTRGPDILRITAPQATDVMVSSPEEFARLIASDTERLGKVIRDAGIKAP